MKLIPIVALVPEDTLAGLDAAVAAHGEVSKDMQSLLDRNGWTLDAIVAGSFISFSLRDAGVIASPKRGAA